MNRWRSLLPFNALLLGLAGALHWIVEPIPAPRLSGLLGLPLLANGWLLLARAVSYRSLERRLPRQDEPAGAALPNDGR